MPSKKPPAVFEVEFTGRDIKPELIPLGTMSRILSAVHSLATGKEPPDEDEDQSTTELPDDIQLVNVKRGSTVLSFSGKSPSYVVKNLREVGNVLRHPEKLGENVRILNPINELSTTARRLNCSIVLRMPSKTNGEKLATIEPNSFDRLSTSVFVRGETTITGFVERVGGATVSKCGLRIASQTRMLICRVESRDVARLLGEHVYQEVIVGGEATWVKSSWRMYSFNIQRVNVLKEGTLDEAIEALRNAGGAGWDNVDDPQGFLESGSAK